MVEGGSRVAVLSVEWTVYGVVVEYHKVYKILILWKKKILIRCSRRKLNLLLSQESPEL